jgi:hypothetical protein
MNVNVTTNFRNPPMEKASILFPALDWQRTDENHLTTGSGNGMIHPSNLWSALSPANSAWADKWMSRGIPELDSPLAR